jgi:hypothetical protein
MIEHRRDLIRFGGLIPVKQPEAISATTSSRRTILTVINPSDLAIATIARPTPELAPFWMTQDPRGSFTMSVSSR